METIECAACWGFGRIDVAREVDDEALEVCEHCDGAGEIEQVLEVIAA